MNRKAACVNDRETKIFSLKLRMVVIAKLASGLTIVLIGVASMRSFGDVYIEAFVCGFVWSSMMVT